MVFADQYSCTTPPPPQRNTKKQTSPVLAVQQFSNTTNSTALNQPTLLPFPFKQLRRKSIHLFFPYIFLLFLLILLFYFPFVRTNSLAIIILAKDYTLSNRRKLITYRFIQCVNEF